MNRIFPKDIIPFLRGNTMKHVYRGWNVDLRKRLLSEDGLASPQLVITRCHHSLVACPFNTARPTQSWIFIHLLVPLAPLYSLWFYSFLFFLTVHVLFSILQAHRHRGVITFLYLLSYILLVPSWECNALPL